MIGQLMLALSILVGIHEAGHFLAARAFGIRVDKFYIFFDAWGKKIWSKKIGGTEYGLGWLPLGGYVKIAGMIDESMDKEQMAQPAKDDEFRSKPAWQRFIVMIGGIVMNVILGILLFMLFIGAFEKSYLSTSEANQQGYVMSDYAASIGLQDGDKILEVNGKTYERFSDLVGMRMMFADEMMIERNGNQQTIKLPDDFYTGLKKNGPEFFVGLKADVSVSGFSDSSQAKLGGLMEGDMFSNINGRGIRSYLQLKEALQDSKGEKAKVTVIRDGKQLSYNLQVDNRGLLGVETKIDSEKYYKDQKYSFGQIIKYGFKEAYSTIALQLKGFGAIFSGKEKVTDSLGGPIMIATVYGDSWNWARFVKLTALISMVLAFMNLLPIPALDGGHILFIGIEAIIGRKLSDSFMEKAQMVGMIILLTLMVFIFGNDIARLFR